MGSWTEPPRDWTDTELVPDTVLNPHLRDQLRHLFPDGGAWQEPAFSAGDFTGGGSMTWVVEAGDLEVLAYVVIGNQVILTWSIKESTISGTPNEHLHIALPAGLVALKDTWGVHWYEHGSGPADGPCCVDVAGQDVRLFTVDKSNWPGSGTNNISSRGQVYLEIA